uniref:Major facilitator superfamily (MFS) profile domain-containing protein n=1 Tax=Alexandrium catenella TaxID=2925 RepID=A0A7S1WU72_ALECA
MTVAVLVPPAPVLGSKSAVAACGQEEWLRQALLEHASGGREAGPDSGVKTTVVKTGSRFYWEGFFVVLPLYFGYASLFGLQHDVKARMGIMDDNSENSQMFGFAISFLYIFNLLFRFLHGIVFARLSSRGRVFVSMGLMSLAMMLLAKPHLPDGSVGIAWVMCIYALGGVAVGTFEPNFLSCIAPLGHQAKSNAIQGIPVGISCVLICGFFVMGPPFWVPVQLLYAGVSCALLIGMGVVTRLPAPPVADAAHAPGLRKFASDLSHYREWLPQTWSYMLMYLLDMFTLAAFSPGVALYIYDKASVTLAPGVTVATDSFFAGFNTANMFGSLLGRWLSYRIDARHPLIYGVFLLAGAALMLLRVPLLVPLSTFLTMLGDGLIYGTTTRHIDTSVPGDFNLVATSCWCLLGDTGAIAGTNLIVFFRSLRYP